ncbi:bacterioferritin comigratory protein [Vibrio zhugei]|uniref:Bacterioferritin comigratory protein n=1 Tax=Vibrio zhugei TaxID=2479546 RepID=A0ABV7CCL9_9VIBR|nr:bacterioferritin comigratory protein [Vibrio zhugei]
MKKSTQKEFEEALERLTSGKPHNRELKKKVIQGKLKINFSTVEKEADKSPGALRHYENIKRKIVSLSLKNKARDDEEYDSVLLEQLKKAKKYGTKQASLKKRYFNEAQKDRSDLATELSKHAKIIERLMMLIPDEKREEAMADVIQQSTENVVKVSFKPK